MAQLDYLAFDADNHYYEARTRSPVTSTRRWRSGRCSGPRSTGSSGCSWPVGSTGSSRTPRSTRSPGPACSTSTSAAARRATTSAPAFGELDPISPAYRNRDARLALMDEQGIEGCFLFPTLGVGMEQALVHDPEAAPRRVPRIQPVARRRLGLQLPDRIFTAPYFTLLDPDRAVAEIDWALGRGARVIVMRAGPVQAPGRSAAHPVIRSTTRSGRGSTRPASPSRTTRARAGYAVMRRTGARAAEMEAFRQNPFKTITSADRPIYDTVAALDLPRRARPPSQRAGRDDRERQRVGAGAREEDEEGRTARRPTRSRRATRSRRSATTCWVSPYYEDDICSS